MSTRSNVIKTLIDTQIVDNKVGLITEPVLRNALKATVDWVDEVTGANAAADAEDAKNATEIIAENALIDINEQKGLINEMKTAAETAKTQAEAAAAIAGNTRIANWTAQAYASGAQVNYNGIDYVASAATLATEVPGVSVKWVERLNVIRSRPKKNLFNKSKFSEVGRFLSSSGNLSTTLNASYNVSEYIAVLPSTAYIVSGNTPGSTFYVYYDINRVIISSFNTNSFTTPANCAFVRLSVVLSTINNLQLELGSSATTYEDFIEYYPGWAVGFDSRILSNSILDDNRISKKIGKNLFDKNTLTVVGSFLSSSGNLSASASYSVSGYIKVLPSTTYTRSGNSVGSAWNVYYDANWVIISSFNASTFTTPANCAFVRLSVVVSTINTLQLELGSSATTYAEYVEYYPDWAAGFDSRIVSNLNAVENKVSLKIGKNLFDKNNLSVVGSFLSTSGNVSSPNANYSISSYIKVLPSTTYRRSGNNIGGAFNIYYDVNRNVISSFNTDTFTTPANCAFVRLSVSVSTINTLQLELGSSATTYADYIEYYPDWAAGFDSRIVSNFNSLKNKISKKPGKNLFDKGNLSAVGSFLSGSGNVSSYNPAYNISDYIAVLPSTNYSCGYSLVSAYNFFYDANYNIIESFRTATFTTPANCAFVRLSFLVSLMDSVQLELGSVSTSYESYREYNPDWLNGLVFYDQKVDVVLPSKMTFVKGKPLNIYYENILRKNLNDAVHARFYSGTNYSRLANFTFSSAAVNQNLVVNTINALNEVSVKNINYKVVDPAANNGKIENILCIGDSFTDGGIWVKELKTLLNADGVTVNQIGTTGNSTFRAEGLSGGRLANCFLDASSGVARLVRVSGVNVMPQTNFPGTKYTDANGAQWIFRGGKIDSSGNGWLRVTKFQAVEADFASFPANGVLTKMASEVGKEGDTVINYTSATPAYYNPFLNHSTGVLDFKNYIEFWGFNIPDVVVIQFTWNDLASWSTDSQVDALVAQFKAAVDHINTAYVNCKVILSIEPFGSIYGKPDWHGKKKAVMKLVDKLIVQFENNASYAAFVSIAPSYACVDLINGYNATTVIPSSRYPLINEQSAGDGVHPSETGMKEIADCVYAVVSGVI